MTRAEARDLATEIVQAGLYALNDGLVYDEGVSVYKGRRGQDRYRKKIVDRQEFFSSLGDFLMRSPLPAAQDIGRELRLIDPGEERRR